MNEQATFTDIRTAPAMERTGEQWRALAAEAGRESAESFERCDSDGFLSQWASQQMQSRYLSMAAIADEGHVCERPARAAYVGVVAVSAAHEHRGQASLVTAHTDMTSQEQPVVGIGRPRMVRSVES